MPKFINLPVNVSTGDTVVVTVNDFYVRNAAVCLETAEQCKRNQQAYENDESFLEFECPRTATQENPTVRFTIPHNGKWFIFYDADQIGGIHVAVEPRRNT